MSNTPTPAALILLQKGISGRELAARLDVTPQAISFQLAGKAAATSPDLLEAVAELADEATARELAEAIDRARAKRLNA